MMTIAVGAADVRACVARAPLRLIFDVNNEKFWNRSDNGDLIDLGGILFIVARRFKNVPYKPIVGSVYLVEGVIATDTLRATALALRYLEENYVDYRLPSEFL